MSDRPRVLEVSSLDTRHPGCDFGVTCGPSLALRLGFDPVNLPEGTQTRNVSVDWLRSRTRIPHMESVVISWEGFQAARADYLRLRASLPERLITELAAIGVMALLIHELEGAFDPHVLIQGEGGDYLVKVKGKLKQVEVSGIRSDPDGQKARNRLSEKSTLRTKKRK